MTLKIPPPVYLLLSAMLMWLTSRYLPLWQFDASAAQWTKWAIAFFVAAGLVIDLSSLLQFWREKTTPNPFSPDKSKQLVVSGWYRFTRNPMYLGMVLLLIAWGIHLGSLLAFAWIGLFIWLLTEVQIKPEERALSAKFDASYLDYCRRVRRWI